MTTKLKEKTVYQSATTTLPGYFATRPPLAPEVGSLLDALRAPFTASPDSLTGQLEFIRENWAPYIGDELKRILLAIDVLREEDIATAREEGATDLEIHDTVLIAAAFCMFNRYVDGLATWQPHDAEMYRAMGKRLARSGYTAPGWEKPVQKAQSQ